MAPQAVEPVPDVPDPPESVQVCGSPTLVPDELPSVTPSASAKAKLAEDHLLYRQTLPNGPPVRNEYEYFRVVDSASGIPYQDNYLSVFSWQKEWLFRDENYKFTERSGNAILIPTTPIHVKQILPQLNHNGILERYGEPIYKREDINQAYADCFNVDRLVPTLSEVLSKTVCTKRETFTGEETKEYQAMKKRIGETKHVCMDSEMREGLYRFRLDRIREVCKYALYEGTLSDGSIESLEFHVNHPDINLNNLVISDVDVINAYFKALKGTPNDSFLKRLDRLVTGICDLCKHEKLGTHTPDVTENISHSANHVSRLAKRVNHRDAQAPFPREVMARCREATMREMAENIAEDAGAGEWNSPDPIPSPVASSDAVEAITKMEQLSFHMFRPYETPPAGRFNRDLFGFLVHIAETKGEVKPDDWAKKVKLKFRQIGISTVTDVVRNLFTLNADLAVAGCVPLRTSTLNLMAQHAATEFEALCIDPNDTNVSDNLGFCSRCNDPGTIDTLCTNCTGYGAVYSRPPSKPAASSDAVNSSSTSDTPTVGCCPNCDGSGPIGTYCKDCEDQGMIYEAASSIDSSHSGHHFYILRTVADAVKAAFSYPQALFAHLASSLGSLVFAVIWDSGATVCLTFDANDFVGPIHPCDTKTEGVDSVVPITGIGEVDWCFQDATGNIRILRLPTCLAPTSTVRLLSINALLKAYPNEKVELTANHLILSGEKGKTNPIHVAYNEGNGLPTSYCHRASDLPELPKTLISTVSEVSIANRNLNEGEKEWLRWHQRLGHCAFSTIQFLMRSHVLAKSQKQRCLHTSIGKLGLVPKCAACQYAKAKQRSVERPRTHARVVDKGGRLRKDVIHPGQEISVDHLISSVKGRLYTGFGEGAESTMYSGTCLFVDNASGFIHCEHQTSMTTHDTLRSKEQFEAICRDHGVIPQQYLSDAASCFTSAEYSNHLRKFDQTQRFAGVGAHHHNGICEKAIQDIQSCARTMLLHAALHWPEVADVQLWPMAIDHAVFLHNHLPNPRIGLSPTDIFTKQRWPHAKFHDLHVFGAPTYVLDKTIADGKSLPKFQPRATRQVYLGYSPHHASSVPLVLNPNTGAITAQFHVVVDDWFQTVSSSDSDGPDITSEQWSRLFGDSEFQFPVDDDDTVPNLHPSSPYDPSFRMDTFDIRDSGYNPPESRPEVPLERERVSAKKLDRAPIPSSTPTPSTPCPTPGPTPVPTALPTPRPAPIPAPQREPLEQREPTQPAKQLAKPRKPGRMLSSLQDHNLPGTKDSVIASPNGRPKRATRAPARLSPSFNYNCFSFNFLEANLPIWNEEKQRFETHESTYSPFNEGFKLSPDHAKYSHFKIEQKRSSTINRLIKEQTLPDHGPVRYYDLPASYLGFKPGESPKVMFHRVPTNDEQTKSESYLSFFKSSKTKSDPDTLNWDQAMKCDPDEVEKWLAAADKEIKALEEKKTWIEVPESEATVRVIPGTWVFRRKRAPDGTITKYKARWVLRGDLQELDLDTTAEVVAWSSVRIFLALSILLGWTIKALDFANAFLQAPLPEDVPVFAFLPRGYKCMVESLGSQRTILRLKKSQYGLTIAPKLWYDHLRAALTEMGFQPSSYDKCFMFKHDALLVTFVDDCGLSVDDEKKIDWFVDELKKRGFELEVEGDFTAFLGVGFEYLSDGRLHMKQTGLIKKILEVAAMQDCNPNATPASTAGLGKDKNGEDWPQVPWKYSSIIGMLIYLATNTRPDISYAVSAAARHGKQPKKSHASAVKMILRYLQGTKDKGIIVTLSGKVDLQTYVDADHCGLYGKEDPRDPDSARSRGGFIIFFGGIPLVWKSSLLTAICLSTLESEYQQLSKTMTVLLGLKQLIEEVLEVVGLKNTLRASIECRVFEDNNGALLLATKQRVTNRTKYLNVRFHHFWSEVSQSYDKDGNLDGKDGKVIIQKIETHKQLADFLTKGLSRELFESNRRGVMGW